MHRVAVITTGHTRCHTVLTTAATSKQKTSFINALIETFSLRLGVYNPFGVDIE